MGKVIFHIDMNCFFASCEIAEDPTLKGKKVVIAHKSLDKKGMVLTASYEAKRLGVYTTMLLGQAERICPDLICVEPHYELYERYSNMFFEYFYSLTPNVEPASIDEAYLDVTDLANKDGYLDLAKTIQDHLLNELNLPCSIGIGPNKFLAKMGSDLKKPLGISVIRKKDVEKILWPLPMKDMFGCGKKTTAFLKENFGINTIGELVNYKNRDLLYEILGENAVNSLLSRAYGEGTDIVDPNAWDSVSSISCAHTLDNYEYRYQVVLEEMLKLVDELIGRLKKMDVLIYSINLSLKYEERKGISRCKTFDSPLDNELQITNLFIDLLNEILDSEKGVRLISCGASKFIEKNQGAIQLSIFDNLDDVEKDHEIQNLIKDINNVVGKDTLKKGARNLKH